MKLENANLLALQSQYMRADITTQAMCAALEPLWQELGTLSWLVLLYPRIDNLSGAPLDEIAWGLHVDAYDATADDMEKRRMIRSSVQIHKYKGTVFAVEQIVADVFGERGTISEWFSYGGEPFHFQIRVDCMDKGAGEDELRRAEELVETGKNLRSRLDGISLYMTRTAEVFFAGGTVTSECISVFGVKE